MMLLLAHSFLGSGERSAVLQDVAVLGRALGHACTELRVEGIVFPLSPSSTAVVDSGDSQGESGVLSQATVSASITWHGMAWCISFSLPRHMVRGTWYLVLL